MQQNEPQLLAAFKSIYMEFVQVRGVRMNPLTSNIASTFVLLDML